MKWIWNKDKRTLLEKEIDNVLSKMEGVDPTTDDYAKMVTQLGKLYEAKNVERPRGVSPDVIWTIAGNILLTGFILTYEQTGALTSRAKDYWLKGRV